ncbi:MAG TPA: histidinol dehydrogenase [Solirubrobacterales bacterium]|nr:histidinol dehydrogenase [Solirubrobacterales bacterium]
MKVSRFDWDGSDARGLAAELRALQPPPGEVADAVARIIDEVERGGDAAVLEAEERFGGARPESLSVDPADADAARAAVPEDLSAALELAAGNIRRVAEAEAMADLRVTLPQGQAVRLRSVPVAAAGAYAPGGNAAYPSTVLMCCVPAKVAGVERVAVVSPPASGGAPNPAVLAASAIAGADEVYATGGVQAIAALALGTESIAPVDVIVGPGNRYVQEAKRQLYGRVGIDGIAGPSELMVILDEDANPDWLALDLCAQAEHGDDGLLVAAAAADETLAGIERAVDEAASARDAVGDAPFALVKVPSPEAALELSDALAPEHLELACEGAEALAASVSTAGCVFVGDRGATAFGDYAAGSNHVLPTGGAGRYTGPLGPTVFRRRIGAVTVTQEAAQGLAPAVATLARAEGFPVHAESVEARLEDEQGERA